MSNRTSVIFYTFAKEMHFPLTFMMSHMDGKIWLMTRSLQLTSFQAYKLRVTHIYQLKQHSILVSVGQDEQGINPLVSVLFSWGTLNSLQL